MASSDLIITNETGNPLLQIGRLSRESEKQSGSLSFICIPELRAVSAFFFFFSSPSIVVVQQWEITMGRKKKRQLANDEKSLSQVTTETSLYYTGELT